MPEPARICAARDIPAGRSDRGFLPACFNAKIAAVQEQAAIDDTALFNVQGLLGTDNGVQKSQSTSGTGSSILPQSTVSYPPLRVSILRN